jgi:transcriptional regulator with XRE-family HTH domain
VESSSFDGLLWCPARPERGNYRRVTNLPAVALNRTTKPLRDELPRLLREQGMSLRGLAEAIGVNQSYLSRILSATASAAARPPSAKVTAAIADELDLPRDYFVEYREAVVQNAIVLDSKLRDRIYDSLPRSRRQLAE